MAIPAVPPITNFRMFLQKPDGTPLASQWYRITWGREAPLPLARTGTNGLIDVELEGDYSWGLLELGEHDPDSGDDASFVPRIQIDLRLVKPPSPPPKHKRKKIELDSPPPSKPPPAQKPAPEKEKKPEEGEPGESLPPDPTLISMPPDKKPAYDFDPEGRRRRTKKEPEKPKESAGEVERRLEKLDRVSYEIHDKQVKVFEITWRLHNLGYLGFWSGHLTFPIDGGKYAQILDAMNRYAFKNGIPLLSEDDLTGAEPTLDGLMSHLVEKTHDKVGP